MHAFFLYTLIVIIKIVVVFAVTLGSVPAIVLVERKVLGWMQVRPGPNRVGPWGLLQTMVDGAKIFFKENVIPNHVDMLTYQLAPILVITPALVISSVIPFGPDIVIAGHRIPLSITDLDLSLLFFFAVASLTIYGVVLAGWSSNNKWSLLGGLRSAAQMVSYEITLSLAAVGVLLLCGTFSLHAITEQQGGGFWYWNVFRQPLGFVLFLLAALAENNRLPFDLPEAESELTGGYHTEYSSMRFAYFYMAEYMNLFLTASVMAVLFLGGFEPPYPHQFGTSWLEGVHGIIWFGIKVGFFVFLYIWVRATLPRLRYDQLMYLGWKIMLPLAFLNLLGTAVFIAYGWQWWQMGLVWLIVLILTDLVVGHILWRRRRALH